MKIDSRIKEIDIFKGILIVLVVIGHATGQYNKYIYQFHVASFFFISGYLSKIDKDSIFKTIYKKFMTLKLPLITIFFLMQLFIGTLNYLGYYDFLFEDGLKYYGIIFNLKSFFINETIYLWFLGAAWFIIVLFYIEILSKFLYEILKDIRYMILISFMLFLLGYYLILKKISFIGNIDLIFIGQMYYVIGFFINYKKIFNRFLYKNSNIIFTFIITSIVILYLGGINGTTVDYPSRSFGNPLFNLLISLNGIFCIFLLSKILKKYLIIETIFTYLGRKTLGILFFHFMFFKVSFFILYKLNIIDIVYFKNFVPQEDIYRYTFLIVTVSIVCSLILWELLNKISIIRILIGEDRSKRDKIYSYIISKYSFLENFNMHNKLYFIKKAYFKFEFLLKKEIFRNILIILILVSIPIIKQSIVNNDELLHYAQRNYGIFNFIKHGISEEIRMGRPTRILASVNQLMGFLFINIYLSRIFQVLLIIISVTLFSYFIYLLLKDKNFSIFLFIMIISLMPITFEHCPPNAFNGLVIVPLIELLLSFIFYKKYLYTNKKKMLIFSAIIFFIACLGYEFVILYGLMFPIMFLTNIKSFNIKEILNKNKIYIIILLIYTTLFLIGKKYIVSNYDGTKLEFVSINSSIKIIFTLIKTSIPGYYVMNGKYKWLFSFFIFEKNIIEQKIYIILRVIIFIYFFNRCMKNLIFYNVNEKNKTSIIPIIVGVFYTIFPTIPNSISKIYQGNVDDKNFTGLPVTYFIYFSMVFCVCYIIWNYVILNKRFNKKIVIYTLLPLICIIQVMNGIFSTEQFKNFEQVNFVVDFLDTETAKKINNNTIYSPQFFEHKNALFISDNYWNIMSNIKGLNIEFTKNILDKNIISVFKNNNILYVKNKSELRVLSKYRLHGINPIQLSDEEFVSFNFENETGKDNDFFYYDLYIDKSKQLKINEEEIFKDTNIGNKLKNIKIEGDYFLDNFVGRSIKFDIKSGDKGIVNILGYMPNKITGKEIINIKYNDKNIIYKVNSNEFKISINCESNDIINIELIPNWSFKAKDPDMRMLSFVLRDIYSE